MKALRTSEAIIDRARAFFEVEIDGALLRELEDRYRRMCDPGYRGWRNHAIDAQHLQESFLWVLTGN